MCRASHVPHAPDGLNRRVTAASTISAKLLRLAKVPHACSLAERLCVQHVAAEDEAAHEVSRFPSRVLVRLKGWCPLRRSVDAEAQQRQGLAKRLHLALKIDDAPAGRPRQS